jgi:hypothetical protein
MAEVCRFHAVAPVEFRGRTFLWVGTPMAGRNAGGDDQLGREGLGAGPMTQETEQSTDNVILDTVSRRVTGSRTRKGRTMDK